MSAPAEPRRLLPGTVRRAVATASAILVGVIALAVASRVPGAAGEIWGMAITGVSAVGAGWVVVQVAWRRRREAGEHARALIGAGLILWGLGQLLICADVDDDGWGVTSGFVCGSLATALVVTGAVRMPRRSRIAHPALRAGLDAVLMASAALLPVWWGMIRPHVPGPDVVTPTSLTAATMAFADLLGASTVLLLWLRDRRRGALALCLGGVLQALADLGSLPELINGRPSTWVSDVLWCAAWPLIAVGMSRLRITAGPRAPRDVLEDLGESRTTTAATIAGVASLVGLLVAPGDHPTTDVAAVLLGAVAGLLVIRELLGNRVRHRLLLQIAQETQRDVLTGLPNRSALTQRIRALDLRRPWSLLTVDLDGFREIDDQVGDTAGDELITAVGELLARHCPPGGMVARLGGDEFGVLVDGDVRAGERLAVELAAAVRGAKLAREAGIRVSVSIGVGRVLPEASEKVAPPDGVAVPALIGPRHDRLVALMESATALQAAKDAGRDRVAVYPGAVEQARERRMVLEWRLRKALAGGDLQMHAQPLVDLATGRVRGFESLARWTDELLGPVSPAEFVPVAEQTGLVAALGDFALRASLAEVTAAGLAGADLEVGVNVSPLQLRLPGFASMVADLVAELGLPPRQLLVEVTEAILIDEDDPAASAFAELSAAGIRLAIDDFGTGYSALGYLRRLPLDVLKIDRSWVLDAFTETRTRRVVAGVVDLAHSLGATVVMEGVEDAEVAAMCLELGADTGQGWYFGRPAPWLDAVRELSGRPAVR